MDVDGNGRIDQAEFRIGCLRTAIEQTALSSLINILEVELTSKD